MSRENVKLLIGAILSAAITWYINNGLGYGPIIANGLIGIIVSILFSPKLAGAYYVASFVGMSGAAVIPSMTYAALGGGLAGIIIILSPEIYGGMGGKGGTTAAFSTQIVRGVLHFFI